MCACGVINDDDVRVFMYLSITSRIQNLPENNDYSKNI